MTAILIIAAVAAVLAVYLIYGGKTQCRNCGFYMPRRAKQCPNCGYDPHHPSDQQ